jgi:hypothetical protein
MSSWAQRRIFVVPTERDVILSAAKDLRRPDREPSLGAMKILRLTAQDDDTPHGTGRPRRSGGTARQASVNSAGPSTSTTS